MKELELRFYALTRLCKSFLLGWIRKLFALLKIIIKWWNKPHTIHIGKKTIIIGVLAVFLAFQTFWPRSIHIVYAGPDTKPPVGNPLIPLTPKKIATLPVSDLQPVQPLQPIEVAPTPTQAPNTQSSTNNLPNLVVAGCGDNAQANFIYMHESGCRTGAQNAGGCLGIGQACPGSKLLAVCPSLDYACENSFFTGYANARYGGWAGAYAFWVANSWW